MVMLKRLAAFILIMCTYLAQQGLAIELELSPRALMDLSKLPKTAEGLRKSGLIEQQIIILLELQADVLRAQGKTEEQINVVLDYYAERLFDKCKDASAAECVCWQIAVMEKILKRIMSPTESESAPASSPASPLEKTQSTATPATSITSPTPGSEQQQAAVADTSTSSSVAQATPEAEEDQENPTIFTFTLQPAAADGTPNGEPVEIDVRVSLISSVMKNKNVKKMFKELIAQFVIDLPIISQEDFDGLRLRIIKSLIEKSYVMTPNGPDIDPVVLGENICVVKNEFIQTEMLPRFRALQAEKFQEGGYFGRLANVVSGGATPSQLAQSTASFIGGQALQDAVIAALFGGSLWYVGATTGLWPFVSTFCAPYIPAFVSSTLAADGMIGGVAATLSNLPLVGTYLVPVMKWLVPGAMTYWLLGKCQGVVSGLIDGVRAVKKDPSLLLSAHKSMWDKVKNWVIKKLQIPMPAFYYENVKNNDRVARMLADLKTGSWTMGNGVELKFTDAEFDRIQPQVIQSLIQKSMVETPHGTVLDLATLGASIPVVRNEFILKGFEARKTKFEKLKDKVNHAIALAKSFMSFEGGKVLQKAIIAAVIGGTMVYFGAISGVLPWLGTSCATHVPYCEPIGSFLGGGIGIATTGWSWITGIPAIGKVIEVCGSVAWGMPAMRLLGDCKEFVSGALNLPGRIWDKIKMKVSKPTAA